MRPPIQPINHPCLMHTCMSTPASPPTPQSPCTRPKATPHAPHNHHHNEMCSVAFGSMKLLPYLRHGLRQHFLAISPQRCCLCRQRCLVWKDTECAPYLVYCLGCKKWVHLEATYWSNAATSQLRKSYLKTPMVWRLNHGGTWRYCIRCKRWTIYCVHKSRQLPRGYG